MRKRAAKRALLAGGNPGASRHKDVRYLDIREDDQVDSELVAGWIRQAADLPGWMP